MLSANKMTIETEPINDRIYLGDANEVLESFQSDTIDSIITSPPYFGQRDYGHPNQIGLETDHVDYIDSLVKVFDQCLRVLKPSGTFWLNIGDNYVGATSQHKAGGSQGKTSRYSKKHMNGIPTTGRAARNKDFYAKGLPMKSLVGMPWRVAFALQERGWILRSDIIWHRESTSESVKDRPTHAHEYIFMFSKKQRYYYDRDYMKTETGANLQSVWHVTGSPFSGAHFATFPPELVERIVLASCPKGGTILDPFGGSGTIGLLCRQYERHFVLIDISEQNVDMASERISMGITNSDKKRLESRSTNHQFSLFKQEQPHSWSFRELKDGYSV